MPVKSTRYRYDILWSSMDSTVLKRVAVLWGGSTKLRKDECISFLHQALADPSRVRATFERMYPYERASLDILRMLGGVTDLRSLSLAVTATGTLPERLKPNSHYSSNAVGEALMARAVVMTESGSRYISYYNESTAQVFADERILAQACRFECTPLPLTSLKAAGSATFRRVQNVLLDLISVMRTVEALGGVGLTKAGDLRANDYRRFGRKMGWAETAVFDGLEFPDASTAYLMGMTGGGLLIEDEDVLVCAKPPDSIGNEPPADVVGRVVRGILALNQWTEDPTGIGRRWYHNSQPQSRVVVLTVLRCLPDPLAWFEFDSFERAMFDRIGDVHSVGSAPHRPFFYNKSPDEERAGLEQWRKEARKEWESADVPWIHSAFCTWLYALGLVELSLQGDRVERFRLTDLGRAVICGESGPEAPAWQQSQAWVVQPTFDVVVYLDSASMEQVTFLERLAQRIQLSQHTAQYKLTRDSVYDGLERGVGVEQMLEGLAGGSREALPTNVMIEIREWAARRERLALHRRASLLEFADHAARQTAIEEGTIGTPVADRFLLLEPASEENHSIAASVIDYAARPPKCLATAEDGEVSLAGESRDLITPASLDLWAEQEGDATWRLTRQSVGGAIKRGRTLKELLLFLQERQRGKLPPLLIEALRAWTGEPAAAAVAEVVVLQCQRPEFMAAVLESAILQPHIIGAIGPDSVMVNAEGVDAVKAVLEWAGARISNRVLSYRS